jgi:DinB superfamily
MSKLDSTLQRLQRAQAGLLRAADLVPAEQWARSPGDEAWSAGEVVAHLIMVERAIITKADKLSVHPPKAVPLLKRFHLPMALVEARFIRRKTPIPLDTALVREKEAMLAELRTVRERTLALIDEKKDCDLDAHRWRHPFLGMLTTYEWFEMIAAHEARHTKQMLEIAANLPKAVASSQK